MSKKRDEDETVAYDQSVIRTFFGKKYVYLLNEKGNLELHRLPSKDAKDAKE